MRKVGVVLAVLALALPVLAAELVTADGGPMLYRSSALGQRTTTVYSNLFDYSTSPAPRPVSGAYRQYDSTLTPVRNWEVGDDLHMTAGGILDSVSFSIWNGDASFPMQYADLTLKFYDIVGTSLVLAGTVTFTHNYIGMPPGGYFGGFTATGLAAQNITLSSNIVATLKYSNIIGGCRKAGQVMVNPPTIGTSQDGFFQEGSWGYWFGGSPVANFDWAIGIIPEPASMILLGLAGLVIRRR
jgi:hypothetical protein